MPNQKERNKAMNTDKYPVLAVCYDFDKTLSPDNMQAQGYLASVHYENQNDFWDKSNRLAAENEMDRDLAWMYLMLKEARGKLIFSRDNLRAYGAGLTLYPGVTEWFDRINKYGESHGVKVEHYIISSGIREMIEGTEPARNGAFTRIYASSFYYDEDGVAVWPSQVINYTSKTQFLFRIEKGVPDVNDPGVNDYFDDSELRVPFRNMVYIGDSDTDIPCMKLVNVNGGHSIGVYNPDEADTTGRKKVHQMMRDNRIRYYAAADYREGSELDRLIKDIVERTALNEKLERRHFADLGQAEPKVRSKVYENAHF